MYVAQGGVFPNLQIVYLCRIYIFFRVMTCLKYYIDFYMYFFYLYNFDIFLYSCYIHIIFYIILYFLYYIIILCSTLSCLKEISESTSTSTKTDGCGTCGDLSFSFFTSALRERVVSTRFMM